MAQELLDPGIRLNLAPVLDVLTERYNPGIGIRSFGRDPELVSQLGAAFIRGSQEHGVSACAKHFPGKGAAAVDAHVELPTIRLACREFETIHLAPFRAAVEAGVDCVMSSHVRFPTLDSKPATFSEKITSRLLRQRLGFRGVVISDDLCMGAITRTWPIQLASVEALKAGHDLLIIAHDRQTQREAADLLRGAVEDGQIGKRAIATSHERIEKLLKPVPQSRQPSPTEGQALSETLSELAIESVRQGALELPLRPNARPLLILLPDFREVSERFTFEGGPLGPEKALRSLLAHWGPARLLRTPLESERLGNLPQEIGRSTRIVFLCFEAMRFPGQEAILKLLKRLAPNKTAVCLIKNPYDRKLLSPGMTALDAGGWRLCQLKAALKRILAPDRSPLAPCTRGPLCLSQ
jgi:beta-N-acetylhexosaminidase